MKFDAFIQHGILLRSRTPHGVRGLKSLGFHPFWPSETSHPSRGAWIEIQILNMIRNEASRRTPHGVRGLK